MFKRLSTVLLFAVLAGCGGGSHATPVTPPAQAAPAARSTQDVAVLGDTPAQLDRGIASAQSAGKHPLFAALGARKKTYRYSPYAQILRSRKAVIVRAYSRIYVFPANEVTLRYGGGPVELAKLPEVNAPKMDAGVLRYEVLRQKGTLTNQYRSELRDKKQKACPDCAMFEVNPRKYTGLAQRWNGAKDPWQADPSAMVAWTPADVQVAQARQSAPTRGGALQLASTRSLGGVVRVQCYEEEDAAARGVGEHAKQTSARRSPAVEDCGGEGGGVGGSSGGGWSGGDSGGGGSSGWSGGSSGGSSGSGSSGYSSCSDGGSSGGSSDGGGSSGGDSGGNSDNQMEGAHRAGTSILRHPEGGSTCGPIKRAIRRFLCEINPFCQNEPVKVQFSNVNGVDHGFRDRDNGVSWPAGTTQNDVRSAVVDDLQDRVDNGQLEPGMTNAKFSTTLDNGFTFGYTATWIASGSGTGTIYIPTYYPPK